MQHKEPRGPRPVCDLLLEKLATAEAEVSQLVPDSAQNSGRNDKSNRSNASNRYAQCLQHCYRAQQLSGTVRDSCTVLTTSLGSFVSQTLMSNWSAIQKSTAQWKALESSHSMRPYESNEIMDVDRPGHRLQLSRAVISIEVGCMQWTGGEV